MPQSLTNHLVSLSLVVFLTLWSRQNDTSTICGGLCVCAALASVCRVKVGYSLLLGHGSDPWPRLGSCSQTPSAAASGRGLQDSAAGVKVHEQPGEAFT